MKKLLIMSALAIGLTSLAGCQSDASTTKESNFTSFGNHDDEIFTTTDTKTNCKYIVYKGYRKGSITPLLKSDGTPDCSK